MHEELHYYRALPFLREASTLTGTDGTNDIIDVTCADPLHEPPEIAINALRDGISQLKGKYPDYKKLKQACTDYYKRHGVTYCTPDNIFVDTSSLIFIAQIFNNGSLFHNKKVLIPAPTFGHYIDIINPDRNHPEYELIFSAARKENGYRMDIVKLEEDIKANKPSVLLLVNPVNPSGVIYTADELKEIARICTENAVFVICDEIFADTISPKNGIEIPSIASFMDQKQLFVTSGIGKSFGYPDARVSWIFGDPENIAKVIPVNLSGSIASLSAKAAEAILSEDSQQEILKYRAVSNELFVANLRLVKDNLTKINRLLSKEYCEVKEYIKLIEPEATTVALLDFSALAGKNFLGYGIVKSSLDIVSALRHKANFATVPGELSMIPPEDMVCRISIADPKKLAKGFDNIQKSIEGREISSQGKAKL